MAPIISTLKFVGSISLGLLTGFSYALHTFTLPVLYTLPSAASASQAFANVSRHSSKRLYTLAGISSASSLIAYCLSPRNQKHPYLLWSALFAISCGLNDVIINISSTTALDSDLTTLRKKSKIAITRHPQMEASYEVLSDDNNGEATFSDEETEDGINGEDMQNKIESLRKRQLLRAALAGVGFAMSIVGIWGDGVADTVLIEM